MSARRMAAAWGAFLLVGGAMAATIVHGAYYRSDHYRRDVETGLTEFFGLPTTIGAIRPHTFTARRLTDVALWLPERRACVFRCPRVVWDTGAAGVDGTVLEVYDPVVCIGSEEWEKGDYMRVLRASLQHNFQDLDVEEVRFHNARLDWPRADFQLTADGVDGKVVFNEDGSGEARLTSYALNGTTVTEPIQIWARLDPQSEDFLPEVALIVPPLPLAALGLDHVLQSPVTQGTFSGKVTLRQVPGPDEVELSGEAKDLRLDELTHRLPGGAIPARLDLTIQEALIRGRQLERITFRGELTQLGVDALTRQMGWPSLGGTARLRVHDGQLTRAGVQRLEADGEWVDLSLDRLAEAVLGLSGVHGQVRVRVNTLVVEDNVPVSGDIDLMGDPPDGETGKVERDFLIGLTRDRLGVPFIERLLARFPEQIEYVQLGAKILIDGDRVRVRSVDGPAGSAMITLRTPLGDLALFGDQECTFPVKPLLDRMSSRADAIRQDLMDRMHRPRGKAPAPQ